ncbi:MAG: NnrU family protein, partial [Oricola sp.]
MIWLVAGLVLFLGVHSVRMVAPGFRDRVVASLGEGPWKGVYTLVSIAGLALLIWGYGQARTDSPVLYEPPVFLKHLVSLFMLVSFILLVATYVPDGYIKKRVKHPMLLAVKIWAFA